ncbi:hypothetical protein ES708_24320 [subsurface metagenome]
MKKIKIGDLPAVRLEIPTHDLNKPEVLQLFNDAKCCGFATIRFPAEHGYCRVTLTVMDPQPKQGKYDLALFGGEPQCPLEEIPDMVEVLNKETLGEDSVIR